MAKSQLFRPPVLSFILTHGGIFPVRRGQRDEEAFMTAALDPRPRRHVADVRGGRPLAHQRARAAEARHRPARARVGRAGRADRDPWLASTCATEAAAVPEGDGAVRRADRFEQADHPSRDQSQVVANEVFARVKALYEALDAQGRRGVLAGLRADHRRPAHNYW